jgi:hypothetical protein
MNLSILETAEVALYLPLSKVNSFLVSFLKLSRRQALDKPSLSVMWCHATDFLLNICLIPAVPLWSVTSRWLKSPPKM